MKTIIYAIALSTIFSCNSEPGVKSNAIEDSTGNGKKTTGENNVNIISGCGNALLFHEGVIVESKTFNAAGKQTMQSIARVTKVFDEAGITVAQLESKISNPDGSGERTSTMAYKCDGKNLLIDFSSLLAEGKKDIIIEGSGFSFPMNITEGQTLPELTYSISMNQGGKKMKITSSMKDRKVIGKENITITGGSFDCYKISSEIEADTEIEGMDEKTKQIMDQMKSKIPKNRMVIWYAPEATVMKFEFFQGDKLVSRNEVTAITQ